MRDFFALLQTRADSEYSWTVDFEARKQQTRRDAAPYQAKEREANAAADALTHQAEELKRQTKVLQSFEQHATLDMQLTETLAEAKAKQREAREAGAKAQNILDAIYDLKAVNPNAPDTTDYRTPEELLMIIDEQGRAFEETLEPLRKLFGVGVGTNL